MLFFAEAAVVSWGVGFAVPVPGGGLIFLVACRPCLELSLFAPYPSPFPGGEGGDQGYFMQGASPPAPRHLTACGTYRPCHTGALRATCPYLAGLTSRCGTRREGLPCLSPADPALNFLFLPPIPPTRARRALFPGGEGGDQGYFMQGASPPAPRHLTACGTYRPCHTGALRATCPYLAGLTSRCGTRREGLPCLSPADPALNFLFLPPIPPTRARRALFPGGEGGDFYFISPGATAPAPLLLNPGGTG